MVQTEFEKCLAGFSLLPGVFQQFGGIWQAEGDANAREGPFLRHGRSRGS